MNDDPNGHGPDRWEPRPLPTVSPESAPYWRAASEGRLVCVECMDCGLVFHYPRSYCPDCLGETGWVEVSGAGTVYTYSVTEQLPGWPDAALPVVIGYVELAEGPRMMTNVVDCAPADVTVGQSVTVTFVPTDVSDVAVPVFRPV